MGQQQLLLVILVTIIVGIATVVAINVFGTSAENANRDAVRQDVLTIGTASQGWFIKPQMMGGGGNSFVGMTFRDITFAADSVWGSASENASNMNGTYVISALTDSQFTVTAYPSSDPTYVEAPPAAGNTMEATIGKATLVWVDNN